MPKMKTNSACKKRFKKTASGLIKRARAFRRHHGWAKDTKTIRSLRGVAYVHKADAPSFQVLMPY